MELKRFDNYVTLHYEVDDALYHCKMTNAYIEDIHLTTIENFVSMVYKSMLQDTFTVKDLDDDGAEIYFMGNGDRYCLTFKRYYDTCNTLAQLEAELVEKQKYD